MVKAMVAIMIYMLLANGFEEVEALAPLDLLRRAGLEVKTVSIEKERTVYGAHGIGVLADLMPEETGNEISLLILPGGMPGSERLDQSPITDRMIQNTISSGGRLAAICAAPFVFGKRGLLQGKRAVCYPGFEKYLDGALICEGPVVTDGMYTTAIGMGAAIAFGAELVSLMLDETCANKILKAIHA